MNDEAEAIQAAAEGAALVFAKNGWTWRTSGDYVPTAEQIAETFRSLLNGMRQSKDSRWHSTGRLQVQRNDDLGCYELMLEVGRTTVDVPK